MKKCLIPLFLLFTVFTWAQTDAPINPKFDNYISQKYSGNWKSTTVTGEALGEIPELITPHFASFEPVSTNLGSKSFPATYDIRSTFVTSVKNQNPYGTCWAHAGCGAIESNWLKLGYGTYDLSESNTATCHGYEWGWNDGGNRSLAASYFSRLGGPISEADDSYSRLSTSDTLCHSGLTPVAFQSNARYLPNNMDSIKKALMDHGAIYTNYYHDNTYMGANNTYYCYDNLGTNHAVLIVGWDDNMATDAAQNGAWIIKNSWGSSWGDNGYFYISYYDVTINTAPAYFITKEDYNAQAVLYNYAEVGYISSTGYGSEIAYGLTKFVATGDQTITKVGTFVNTENAVLDFEIYDTKSGNTLSGLLGTLNGQQCDYPGYYMFDLSSGINISSGNDFYVKVKYNTPGYNYPIPFEKYYAEYADPTIESDVCWYGYNGTSWTLIGNTVSGKERDLTIKAYAVPQISYDVTFNVNDGTNPIENAEVTFNGSTQNTNASGQTIFTGLSDGTHAFSITKSGYLGNSGDVTVNGGNVTHNATLNAETYSVTFSVTDGTNPIENAEVTFNGSTQNTNASGQTIFANIGVGNNLTYLVSYAGYGDFNGTVDVIDQDITENVVMGSLPTTKLRTAYCGYTTSDLGSYIMCDRVEGEQDYEFEFSNTSLSYSYIYNSPSSSSSYIAYLSQVTGLTLGYTYDVRVRARTQNTWGDWGTVCQITINQPTTKLRDAYCGYTTSNIGNYILCDRVSGEQEYEFEFTNSSLSYNYVYSNPNTSSSYVAYLGHVTGLAMGYTYDVRVRAKTQNTWGDWGSVCQVTINHPTTKLRDAYCDFTTNSISGYVLCDRVSGEQDYEFEFTNSSLSYSYAYNNPSSSSSYVAYLGHVTGLTMGYTYDVRVRAKTQNTWSDWGTVCQITFDNTKSLLLSDKDWGSTLEIDFYPNPFSYDSKLKVKDQDNQLYNIYISDITGKLIYDRTISANEEYKIGEELDKGIYLLIILGNNNNYKEVIKFVKQ